MDAHLSRRSFICGSALVGVGSLLGEPLSTSAAGTGEGVDLAAATGRDFFKSTLAAVDQLGGMGRFVPKGARVGLLINDPFRNPGTYVNPEIALAVIKMCFDAGAKSIQALKDEPRGYWQRTPLAKRYADEIKSVTPCSGRYVQAGIRRAVSLKQAEVIRELMEVDVFLNISVSKDHSGTHFSGILKNVMGAATYSTCRYFHYGKGGWSEDVEFLSQCIADVNLLRKPALCISDSTECVVTNGPYGPGKIVKPQKVVAGADPVAVDAYGAGLIGLVADQIDMIGKAAALGVGEMKLQKLQIRELNV
jgi:uncharacterized protein (DUF362 family)